MCSPSRRCGREYARSPCHEGLNRDRLCQINNELAAIALEKNCWFLNLWEVLADENGDLIESYAQPDGYHLRPAGYAVWTDLSVQPHRRIKNKRFVH